MTEPTHEQIDKALSDPASPIYQELKRRSRESERPGAKRYSLDEILSEIDDNHTPDEEPS